MQLRKKIQQGISEALVILLVAVVIGFIFNHFYQSGIPLIPNKSVVRADSTFISADSLDLEAPGEPRIISLELAHALFEKKNALFIDARKSEHYEFGHIPGARLLSWNGMEEPPELPTDLDPDQLIVVYCSDPGCELAAELAWFLFENGYLKILIFEGGWEEWTLVNFPVEKGAIE